MGEDAGDRGIVRGGVGQVNRPAGCVITGLPE
jgi:hypothetical protein